MSDTMSHADWELDPARRDEFFRQLQQLTTQVHAARNVDEIMLDVSESARALFGGDRLTIYSVGEDRSSLVSKVKTGLASFRQLKLPISAQSVAGYAALSRKVLNIADVYNAEELRRYAPELRFQQGVDRRTGYRTQQMLVIPILHEIEVIGVFQLINNLAGGMFGAAVVEGARYLCDSLAVAFAQRQQAPVRERAGFVGALRTAALGRGSVEQALQQARQDGRDIEDVLLDEFNLKLPVVGRALADHFSVPYLGYHTSRRVPQELLAEFDRAFAQREQWLPVERNGDRLFVVCVDPERTRTVGGIANRFGEVARPVFCVTTRREFAQMLDQYFGPVAPEPSAVLAPAQQARLLDTVAALVAGSHGGGLSSLSIDTAPGERPGEVRFTVTGILHLDGAC